MGKLEEKQILAIVKKPGKAPQVEPLFTNSLHALQEVVGGYIETVTFCEDLVIVCNEDGRLMGLPENVTILGVDFVGPIVAVGMKGDDFASLKASVVPGVLRMLGGKSDGKNV